MEEENTVDYTNLKYNKMRALILAMKEYMLNRAEDYALIINRHLQAYSVVMDLSVFDPDTSLASEFFVNLYQLFNKIEPNSQMSWYCVELLTNVCRNPSTRTSIVNTYQFIPCLSRMLCDQLTFIKRKKLLRLMQDLSCGIKISWQIPHLPHLMKTLTKWVENDDEDIVCLSLGVLVNLCYKNLPAVYTLSTCTDVKKFIRICIPLQGPIIEVHVCKLMMILDYMHGDVPREALMKFISPAFVSTVEAFKNNDATLLRQIVDFFFDCIKQCVNLEFLKKCEPYVQHIERLIELMENNVNENSKEKIDPECISLVFELIDFIITKELNLFTELHCRITKLALDWIQTEKVSFHALSLVMRIVKNVEISESGDNCRRNILKEITRSMPALILILQSDSAPTSMEGCKRLGALLCLLRAMLQENRIRQKVLESLTKDTVRNIFASVNSATLNVDTLPRLRSNNSSITSTASVDTYLYALVLLNELAQHDASWVGLRQDLMGNRKIHLIIAQALYGGSKDIKSVALEITRFPQFPIKRIASAMESTQSVFINLSEPSQGCSQSKFDLSCPVLSVSQVARLDDTLEAIKRHLEDNDIRNIATSHVMELYEYKVTTLAYAERTALNSIEAATERCTQLQHCLAQLTAEQNKLQQLLFHTEQCLEQANKTKEEQRKLYGEEKNRVLAEIGRYKMSQSQLKLKEKALTESETKLAQCRDDLLKKIEETTKLEEKLTKSEITNSKLQEEIGKLEKNLQKKEDNLKKANAENEKLNLQVQQLEMNLGESKESNREAKETIKNLIAKVQTLEEALQAKENKLAATRKQYEASKAIIESITNLTSGNLP